MCITAHPDDESGAFGGALLLAKAAGVETSVVCLTEGKAATNRGSARSNEELAQIRRAEFAAAAEVLGVGRTEVLHYPDGRLASVNFGELTRVLVQRIREWRPQVVLAFGSEGGANLHHDHIIACLAATAAFQFSTHESTDGESTLKPYRPQKLYYSCPPFVISKEGGDAESVAQTPHSLTLELGALRPKKLEAFLKHESQASVADRFRKIFEQHGSTERYLLVASRGSRAVDEDHALFAGVVED